jgi:hypothetical protein
MILTFTRHIPASQQNLTYVYKNVLILMGGASSAVTEAYHKLHGLVENM